MARDKRFKNAVWHVCDDIGNLYQSGAMLAVLMDIRDELQRMQGNLSPLQRLNCPDFMAIPRKLERIARNTVKPKRKRQRTGAKP